MSNFRLTAAYGRRYLTEVDCLRAWEDGHDFKIKNSGGMTTGRYCSNRDFAMDDQVTIEWGQFNEEITLVYGEDR